MELKLITKREPQKTGEEFAFKVKFNHRKTRGRAREDGRQREDEREREREGERD